MTPTRKTSLASALHEASGRKSIAAEQPTTSSAAFDTPAAKPQANREGKKIISGHFDPAAAKQFKQIALDNDTTVQDLLREALNDLFVKYGKKPLA